MKRASYFSRLIRGAGEDPVLLPPRVLFRPIAAQGFIEIDTFPPNWRAMCRRTGLTLAGMPTRALPTAPGHVRTSAVARQTLSTRQGLQPTTGDEPNDALGFQPSLGEELEWRNGRQPRIDGTQHG